MENIWTKKFLFYKLGLEIEKETLAQKKKNKFILKIINEIGKSLDKNFLQIINFDYDSNVEDFIDLFNYFDSFCDKEKEKEKSIAIHSISIIILQIDNLSDIWEKIINQVNQIIFQDNYLKDKERRKKLISNIMDDLKLVLGEKKRNYLDSFAKKFEMNVITLLELINLFLTYDEKGSRDLLYFTFKEISENYKKLIISEDIFDSAEVKDSISLNDLNQLLLLNFKDEQNIIVFEQSKFKIRHPNLDELEAHIKENPSKKIKDYFYYNSTNKINKENEQNINNTTEHAKISFENIDVNSLNPVEKFLVDQLKIHDIKLNKLKQENIQLRFKMGIMDKDLKKIKLRSLYKGI